MSAAPPPQRPERDHGAGRMRKILGNYGLEWSPPSKDRIFISYRRHDASYLAGRLNESLSKEFGSEQVFTDIKDFPPSAHFADTIEQAILHCTVQIVIISNGWLEPIQSGRHDFVRSQVEIALSHGIRILPVLVDNASMPREEDLPTSLRPLAKLDPVVLTRSSFKDDIEHLIQAHEPRRCVHRAQPSLSR